MFGEIPASARKRIGSGADRVEFVLGKRRSVRQRLLDVLEVEVGQVACHLLRSPGVQRVDANVPAVRPP